MTIDIATLSLILIFLGMIQVLIFYLLAKRYSHFKGIRTCVLGSFLLTLGAVSVFCRKFIMLNSLYIVMSNLIIAVGLVIVFLGIFRFLGKKIRKTVPVCVLAAYVIGFLCFTYISDNMNIRMMLFSFCFCILSVMFGADLLRSKKSDRLFSTKLMGIILLAGGVNFLIRGCLSIFTARLDNFFDPTALQSTSFIFAVIMCYVWSFGLVIMIFERVSIQKNEAQKKYQDIYDTIPDLICIVESDSGVIVEANDRFIERIGFSKQETIGKNVFEVALWKNEQERHAYIDVVQRNGHIENYEVEIPDRNGKIFTGLVSGRLIQYNGKTSILSIIRDINIRKGLERELQLQAQTDMLTGVSNRRYFFEILDNEILHSKTTRHESVFMMIDIDHFKRVNDTYGHGIGDTAMKMIAEASKSVLRTSDLFGRVGGDEFGVLLVNTDAAGAEKIAERMSKNVQNIDLVNNEGVKINLRISIGISKFRFEHDTIEDMIARADKALYEAKEAGRNRVVTNW